MRKGIDEERTPSSKVEARVYCCISIEMSGLENIYIEVYPVTKVKFR